jgi:hypothetical protein
MAGSKEFFYRDANGVKQDAALHQEMLAGDHPEADAIGIKYGRLAGLTEDEIALLYGVQSTAKKA